MYLQQYLFHHKQPPTHKTFNKHYKIKVFVKNKQTINLNHPDKNNLNRLIKQ